MSYCDVVYSVYSFNTNAQQKHICVTLNRIPDCCRPWPGRQTAVRVTPVLQRAARMVTPVLQRAARLVTPVLEGCSAGDSCPARRAAGSAVVTCFSLAGLILHLSFVLTFPFHVVGVHILQERRHDLIFLLLCLWAATIL